MLEEEPVFSLFLTPSCSSDASRPVLATQSLFALTLDTKLRTVPAAFHPERLFYIPGSHLHFGADAVGDLVPELVGGGVRLGQQERIRQRAILRLHDLGEREE